MLNRERARRLPAGWLVAAVAAVMLALPAWTAVRGSDGGSPAAEQGARVVLEIPEVYCASCNLDVRKP